MPSRAIIILFCITFTLQPSTGCTDLISSGTPRARGTGGCCSREECEPSHRILGVSSFSFSTAEAPHAQHGWFTGLRRNPSYAHYPCPLDHLDPQRNDQWKKAFADREIEFSSISDIWISHFSLYCDQYTTRSHLRKKGLT